MAEQSLRLGKVLEEQSDTATRMAIECVASGEKYVAVAPFIFRPLAVGEPVWFKPFVEIDSTAQVGSRMTTFALVVEVASAIDLLATLAHDD